MVVVASRVGVLEQIGDLVLPCRLSIRDETHARGLGHYSCACHLFRDRLDLPKHHLHRVVLDLDLARLEKTAWDLEDRRRSEAVELEVDDSAA